MMMMMMMIMIAKGIMIMGVDPTNLTKKMKILVTRTLLGSLVLVGVQDWLELQAILPWKLETCVKRVG
jgi:hypothetical protein